MKNNPAELNSNFSIKLMLFYLLSSFFGGLLFSILSYRSRKKGNAGFGWIILSIVFIVIFSYISFALYKTSSANHDAFWYYLSLSTIAANSIALFILLMSFFLNRSNGISS
jgi:hypothetical protein